MATASLRGRPTVKWLSVNPSTSEFRVVLHHVFDDGAPDFRDVYVFPPVDEDEYIGEGVDIGRHADPVAALDSATQHGATSDRWVNFGVIADEYGEQRGWS